MTQFGELFLGINGDAAQNELAETEKLARGLGSALTGAFKDAAIRGKDFGEVMRSLGMRLSSMALNAAMKPVEQGLSGIFQGLLGGMFGGRTGHSLGGALAGQVTPFATGGVISTPGFFPMGPNLGVAGERGAEAILPLARGADGKLGVRAGGEAKPLSVTVNISTPDAVSFRRSEAYLSNVIARAVSRGDRNL